MMAHFVQNELLAPPDKGNIIQSTHGLRKIRIADNVRNKDKRSKSASFL